MRKQQVQALIEHVKEDLKKIENEYRDSIASKAIKPSLQIDVKNVMENIRSSFDYLAHDIYDKCIESGLLASNTQEIRDVYFPYGKDENGFKSTLGKSLPQLKTRCPKMFDIVEGIQPHKSGSNWLYDLCTICNQNKHNTLTPQKRRVVKKTYAVSPKGSNASISAPAGAIKAPPGAIRIGGQPLIFDENTGIPVPTPGLDVKVTNWVGISFSDTNIDVLPLLRTATSELERISNEIYSNL
ncbi:hypothetical protein ACFLXA_01565 [Chloroflexota bacterium]